MALFLPLELIYWPLYGLVLIILFHLVPWLYDPLSQRGIPGPFIAQFSDGWLALAAYKGKRSETVHRAHLKYGPLVRIAPNHISIANPDALQIVYGHQSRTLKSDFYDAFVSIARGLFNTRSRPEHTRKRKMVSALFSTQNVTQFEFNIREALIAFVGQFDRIAAEALDNSLDMGKENDTKEHGWAWMDVLSWFNYLAFDIIGDLAFGQPFGMIKAGKDVAQVAVDHSAAFEGQGLSHARERTQFIEVPAIEILNKRGEFSAFLGVLRPWIRPYIRRLPGVSAGGEAVKNLAGMAIAAVSNRLAEPPEKKAARDAFGRTDLLAKLQEGKDEDGNPMGQKELTAEALTQLIAGSDTTSNSSCAIIYYLAKNTSAQTKLRKELDDELVGNSDAFTSFDQVRHLPYLNSCINEALRLHSTSSLGLPRLVPEGGLEVCGRWYPKGTILSVPSYTIHRDAEVWGADFEEYRPERWLEGSQERIQKTFNPFSYGPRACVGKNLANMELILIISTVIRRYEFRLANPNQELETREGFLRKPLHCHVGMRRRC